MVFPFFSSLMQHGSEVLCDEFWHILHCFQHYDYFCVYVEGLVLEGNLVVPLPESVGMVDCSRSEFALNHYCFASLFEDH